MRAPSIALRTSPFLFALIFFFAVSCASNPPVSEKFPALKIEGDASAENKACIEFAVSKLPMNFRRSLKTINVVADHKHFEFPYMGGTRVAIGHTNSNFPGKICLRADAVTYALIWHEAAHVYSYDLYYFERDWQKAAGKVYDDYYEDYFGEIPSDGLLTNYSRKNYLEDIAEWVESCYMQLYIDPNYWAFQNDNIKRDLRYQKKLALLYEYGFISSSNYEKLKPLFAE